MFCPHCGKEISEGQSFCQHCGSRLVEPGPIPITAVREKTDWENREEMGFFTGLFKTMKAALFHPTAFFRTMSVSGGLTDPLLYSLIVGMVGIMAHYLWDVLLYSSMSDFLDSEVRTAAGRSLVQGFRSPFAAVITPFMLIFWLFVIAGLLHVFLLWVRGAKAGFEATFRVVCYGISPLVFLVVPFCGMPVSGLWVMTIALIGLREAHETTGGRAAFAVLFPFLFFCGILMAVFALFLGAMAASFGSLMHFYR